MRWFLPWLAACWALALPSGQLGLDTHTKWLKPRVHRRRRANLFRRGCGARASARASDKARTGGGSGGGDPLLILPGFLSGSDNYIPLREELRRRGYQCEIVDVRARDWAPTFFGGGFNFYLDKLDEAVKALCDSVEDARPVRLIGHSAGGWLARLWMGGEIYNGKKYDGASRVSTLVCLGTPHYSQEKYPFGRVPETRVGESVDVLDERARGSSLWFTNTMYPGAFHPNVRYVSICGRAVKGQVSGPGVSFDSIFAYSSYQANSGDGNLWGDGVTDFQSARLEGTEWLELPDCGHSPNKPYLWYGSDQFLEKWEPYLK